MLYTETTREQSASDAATRALASASERTSENQRDDRSRPMPAMPHSHEPRMNRIARRAHEIYEARGGEHGTELGDWLQAEREVDAEVDASRGAEG